MYWYSSSSKRALSGPEAYIDFAISSTVASFTVKLKDDEAE
jgi:hypothetical protein